MDINQALTWMKEYVEAEWTSIQAVFTEPDIIASAKKWRPVRKFVAKGVSILDVLPRNKTTGDGFTTEIRTDELAKYQKRKIYAVTKSKSKKFGEVFTFYVSDINFNGITLQPMLDQPRLRIHSTEVEGEMKIIAWDAHCTTCGTTGMYQGQGCGDCYNRGWTMYGGYKEHVKLGRLTFVEKRIIERTSGDISDIVFSMMESYH